MCLSTLLLTSIFRVNLPTGQLCDGGEKPLPLLCGLLCVSLALPGAVGVRVVSQQGHRS